MSRAQQYVYDTPGMNSIDEDHEVLFDNGSPEDYDFSGRHVRFNQSLDDSMVSDDDLMSSAMGSDDYDGDKIDPDVLYGGTFAPLVGLVQIPSRHPLKCLLNFCFQLPSRDQQMSVGTGS